MKPEIKSVKCTNIPALHSWKLHLKECNPAPDSSCKCICHNLDISHMIDFRIDSCIHCKPNNLVECNYNPNLCLDDYFPKCERTHPILLSELKKIISQIFCPHCQSDKKECEHPLEKREKETGLCLWCGKLVSQPLVECICAYPPAHDNQPLCKCKAHGQPDKKEYKTYMSCASCGAYPKGSNKKCKSCKDWVNSSQTASRECYCPKCVIEYSCGACPDCKGKPMQLTASKRESN